MKPGYLRVLCVMVSGFGLCTAAFAQVPPPPPDCEVEAEGVVRPSGGEFAGAFSSVAGVSNFTWVHRAPGLLFETDTTGEEVICRTNGGVIGEASTIDAVLNGTPGYRLFIQVADNGPPHPDFIPLCARLIHEPVRERSEYTLSFASPRTVIIPDELQVLKGSAGTGSARLKLDNHTCRYQGDGSGPNYVFERCTGPDGAELLPGDTLDVSKVQLRIQSADSSAPVTYVETNIGTSPMVGAPDAYTLLVGDAEGVLLYSEAGLVVCGDIKVNRHVVGS